MDSFTTNLYSTVQSTVHSLFSGDKESSTIKDLAGNQILNFANDVNSLLSEISKDNKSLSEMTELIELPKLPSLIVVGTQSSGVFT